MSRRARDDEPVLSLDAFLDIATNVVGILILVAVVTVLGAGDISISSGATALTPPQPQATRVLFEIKGEKLYLVDEKGNGERVRDEARRSLGPDQLSSVALETMLVQRDVGDRIYRVQAMSGPEGLSWIYSLRADASGDSKEDLARGDSTFQRKLEGIGKDSFVYFVVHEDSFDMFRRARDVAAAKGIAVGWHPVEGSEPLRLSTSGSLGKRVQ